MVFYSIGTPGQPLGGCMRHFNMIEANMKLRYVHTCIQSINIIKLRHTLINIKTLCTFTETLALYIIQL